MPLPAAPPAPPLPADPAGAGVVSSELHAASDAIEVRATIPKRPSMLASITIEFGAHVNSNRAASSMHFGPSRS